MSLQNTLESLKNRILSSQADEDVFFFGRSSSGDSSLSASVSAKKRKRVLHTLLLFVPGFFSRGLVFRLGISAILLAASFFIISTLLDKSFGYLRAAMLYDPYQHAKGLCDGKKFADADEFLTFYANIPYAEITDEMRSLHDEIRKIRGRAKYQLSEAWRGLIEGESDEMPGQVIVFVSEFFFIGDLRDLSGEGKKYFHGEEMDKLTVSLASVGLGMSAVSFWGPQAAAAAAAKNGLSLCKHLSKRLKAPMRASIMDAGEIAAKLVKAKMEKIASTSSLAIDSVKKLDFSSLNNAWNKTPPIDENVVLKNADDIINLNVSFSALKTTGQLATMDKKAAAFVIMNSDDMRTLGKNADLAKKLGKESGIMLESSGIKTLQAVEKYPPTLIKEALVYGQGGINYLLQKGSAESLRVVIRTIKTTYTGKIWYNLKSLIYALPLPFTIGLVLYMLLTLGKTWFLRPVKQTR
jgi:hypothetical protein